MKQQDGQKNPTGQGREEKTVEMTSPRSGECRAKLEECHALAETTRDPDVKRQYKYLAVHWLQLADARSASSSCVVGTGQSRSDNCQMGSGRPIAFDCHPAARACLRVVVPECLMLGASVVPEGDRMGLPAEPHLKFLPCAELTQKFQYRFALFFRQPVDMGGEFAVDVQRLAL